MSHTLMVCIDLQPDWLCTHARSCDSPCPPSSWSPWHFFTNKNLMHIFKVTNSETKYSEDNQDTTLPLKEML